jgi:Mce-associated membrane protein
VTDNNDQEKTTVPSEPESGAVELGAETTTTVETTPAVDDVETTTAADGTEAVEATDAQPVRRTDWSRVLAYGILPGLALILALGAGYLKFVDNTVRNGDVARVESVQAAKDGTISLLSYAPDKVEQQLGDAQNLLTGDFRDSYRELVTDVVIPGAKQQQISAVATVPAAASVSAEPNHAVVLVFINQTVVVGNSPPTDTASSVRVTLQKAGDKWLISAFDPV